MTDDRQHFDAAQRYDAGLVALEAFTFAGVEAAALAAQRGAMLHAYATRIGALIAAADPAEENALVDLAEERIVKAAQLVRMLRS